MKLMVVGGGGREHAIIRKLRENPEVKTLYALPGNAGIAQDAEIVPIPATDLDRIVHFAEEKKIDFAVIAPDDPLAMGLVDRLHEKGIACFGPDQKAAEIESSKIFAKNLMKKYGIPTAAFEVFEDLEAARAYVQTARVPLVVKADGLALGKGVLICATREEALEALEAMMVEKRFGKSGTRVVIEEFLEGPEVSVLSFTDGETIVPMVSSMDHKRALDGDQGLNTGGMGTVAPNPYYTREIAERTMREILLPTVQAMKAEGRPFKGCLYFGLMLTKDGPKVIEYNCRFGDPETQVVLPLLKTDLLTIMRAVEDGRLKEIPVEFRDGADCCVILASGGYPEHYEKGKVIDLGRAEETAQVFHSGTALDSQGHLVTAGGRVLGVTFVSDTLKHAIEGAYRAADQIQFEGRHLRRDIGARALKALEE
ncbi:MAG TPA: phosphoribosylamine--glycine ligase [Candidatus Pullichristensenella excrementigallinarum]|uniref:Phosphoribosylamine--glycine ligase n=1 Tax=Candidatus Pullichristensenella excrementigallinarum TaxID=2840907 RepID=A0A9D1IDS0_9FIRM|nr:phosphoribosylamine--glycine ligase [Candidatus Pullichristensenella excrementigallinarum]